MSTKRQTIILPGYSAKNKDWAEGIAQELKSSSAPTVYYWEHWTNEDKDPDWIDQEVKKIKDEIGGRQVDLIVKSLGTYVAIRLLEQDPSACGKLILCGIPLNDLSDSDKKAYEILSKLPAENVAVIQNETDSHGTFAQVEAFVHAINPEIKVISKPRDDHEYPYSDDFKEFLG